MTDVKLYKKLYIKNLLLDTFDKLDICTYEERLQFIESLKETVENDHLATECMKCPVCNQYSDNADWNSNYDPLAGCFVYVCPKCHTSVLPV